MKFNDDPKDDITAIKDELDELIKGVSDKELEEEISDLKNYVEKLYTEFIQIQQSPLQTKNLQNELDTLSAINRIALMNDTR